MTKKQAIAIITKCAKQYQQYLEGNQVVFVYRDENNKSNHTSVRFHSHNFLHFTGVTPRTGMNANGFYRAALNNRLTGEDVALDDSWNYTDILWNGIQAEKVQRAFEKLNYREQTLLEKRLAICMTCGRVGSWKNRPTFEELAIMFEGSTASGAERAYRKAADKLTELLVAEGALHAVRLKQKSKTKRKKKSAAAIYEYQADCDGEWGEISFDFENGTAEIVRLADWDTIKTNWFVNEAIWYTLSLSPDALKKYMLVPLEPLLIS